MISRLSNTQISNTQAKKITLPIPMGDSVQQPGTLNTADLDNGHEMRLVKINTPENIANNVRMYLSKKNVNTLTTFAGEKAGNISPSQYEEYFQKIKKSGSWQKFIELSEKALMNLSKLTRSKVEQV